MNQGEKNENANQKARLHESKQRGRPCHIQQKYHHDLLFRPFVLVPGDPLEVTTTITGLQHLAEEVTATLPPVVSHNTLQGGDPSVYHYRGEGGEPRAHIIIDFRVHAQDKRSAFVKGLKEQ